jgi:uncharacterized protein YdeI (YjbR/CyaY-like superfamily)
MANNPPNEKVDAVLRKATQWQDEFAALRKIIRGCGLTEELKWGNPCYLFEGRNVVLIHGFKEYCALLFFKGALMQDPNGILIQQTENVQASRQIRFTHGGEITQLATILKAYVREAIAVEKSGRKVDFKKTTEYAIPEEFQKKLDEVPGLKKAFDALTPGRRRAYLLYFSAPKQGKTREARAEKSLRKILSGKGLDDPEA